MKLHRIDARDEATGVTISQFAVTAETPEDAEHLLREQFGGKVCIVYVASEIGTNEISGPARVLGRVGEHWEREFVARKPPKGDDGYT